ncbi:helix-turn-helix protein [Micromonospora kangleipakensis]|uniref:Helix-turn-helix protein n=2 Tax=Micromonospora kangleipakensis TaxID=1077942 RepID=A0A4Q8B918_9ACTN|nr:helix-turn-helix protein [Micromonospora kangleipakensis]
MAPSWRDTRSRMNLDEAKVAEHTERMLGEIRAERLKEVRERHGVSQTELAGRMEVSQARVSAIEKGELSTTEFGTIARYVAGLGGKLQIVADFGDEQVVLS